ncbi:MAG: glycoside hydrolase family 88 protein [Gemmatimonadota bacterium]|nr:glycoside hydrolase family 88 protein [Gemmatimonadota bacterium]
MKKTALFLGLTVLLALLVSAGCGLFGKKVTPFETSTGIRYKEVLSTASVKVSAAYMALKGRCPVYSEDGKWSTAEEAGWAQGYYPGLVWLLYQSTRDTVDYNLALGWCAALEDRRNDKTGIGLGQLFYRTHVIGYQITSNRRFHEVALDAANSLAERFVRAGYIPAWGEPGDSVLARRMNIETMMALDLLYWASKATGNPKYLLRANSHALFTMRNLVNADGRSLHMADFNPATGRPLMGKHSRLTGNSKYSPKGYSPSTAWALGQAWALYGFTSAYSNAGNTLFLNTARRAADYFLANLPEDGIPYWDFDLPDSEKKQKDTGAAAIAAAALLKLSRLCPNEADRMRYRAAAEKIVSSLTTGYLNHGSGGLLNQGVYDMNQGLGVGGSTVWGDYFYIEALLFLRDYKT